jgi:hypothetical protein
METNEEKTPAVEESIGEQLKSMIEDWRDKIMTKRTWGRTTASPNFAIEINIGLTNNQYLPNSPDAGIKNFYIERCIEDDFYNRWRENPPQQSSSAEHLADFFGENLTAEQQSAIARIEDRMREALNTPNSASILGFCTHNENKDNLFNVLYADQYNNRGDQPGIRDGYASAELKLAESGTEIHSGGVDMLNKRILDVLLELDKEIQTEKTKKLSKLSAPTAPKLKSAAQPERNI